MCIRMRLLVIGLDQATLDPSSASAARQVAYYAGYVVDIVVVAPGSRSEVKLSPQIRVMRAGGLSFHRACARILCLLVGLRWKNRYDVITVQEPVICGALALITGRRVPIHLQDHSAHFSSPPQGHRDRLLSRLARFVVRHADRVRTVSLRGKRGLESIGISSDKIDIVPVPTDISQFEKFVHTPSDHLRLLCIARLSREKGVDVLFKAFRRVLDKRMDAMLTIVGDGPEHSHLERLARSLNLGSSVTFAGHQSDLETFFSNADIYVQPSRFEGWGMAVIEAAAAGVPIVMTDVGCAGEVIVNGQSGFVVPPEDETALSEAIIRLIDDPAQARRLADGARQSVQALSTVEQAVASVRTSLERTAQVKSQSSLWPLFLSAFAIRALLFVAILFFVGQKGLELGDSIQYQGLARSLLAGHGFSLDGVPFFYRTVGYPLFLAGGLAVFRSTAGFILFQIALASFLPLLVLRLGRELRLGKRVTCIAAWVTALEPHLVYYSVIVLTESVYTLLLLAGCLFVFRAMETKRIADSLRAGIAFGAGMLIKPLLQLFPFVLFVVMLPWARRINWRTALTHTFVILGIVMLMLAPWMERNRRALGSFSLSDQGQNAALFYLGTSIVSVRDHLSYPDAEERVIHEFARTGGTKMTAALRYITDNPSIFVRLIAINTVTLWTSSNYNSFLNYYHLVPPVDHSVLPPTHYIAQGRFGDFVSSFWKIFSQPFYLVGVLGRIVWTGILLLFLYGLLAAYRRIPDRRFQLLFLVALCLYFTATIWVDGLGIEARLRYPLMPIQLLYAAYGWSVLRKKRRATDKLRLLVVTQRVDDRDTNLATHVRWLKEFASLCESVTVITQSVGTYELPQNVRVLSLGKERGASKLKQFLRLHAFVWKEALRHDAIFVLMVPLYVVWAAPAALLARRPIYLWYTHKHVSWTLRTAVFFVRRVFSASQESFRLNTPKARFIGHAIDTDFFTPDSSVTRTHGKLITVGRISSVKRLDLLIDAIDSLRRQGRDVTLHIIGVPVVEQDHFYKMRLHEQLARLGLDDFVSFCGGLSEGDILRAYQTASVCLNASQTGSIDRAMLEAMACGCPVVTSNEAFRVVVPLGGFVDPATPQAFADAIRSQLDHPVALEALRPIVVGRHNLQRTLGALVADMREAVQ